MTTNFLPCVARPEHERRGLPTDLQGVLTALVNGRDAAGMALLETRACAAYARLAETARYHSAKPTVGPASRRVWQSFQLSTALPPELHALAVRIGGLVNDGLRLLHPPPCPPFAFNEHTLQRYATGAYGITPHRDHRRYRYLAAVVVLAGRGRFVLCADRAGRDAYELPAPAGTLVLMRAPAFADAARRPFHAVLDIAAPRLTLGLRYDSTRHAET